MIQSTQTVSVQPPAGWSPLEAMLGVGLLALVGYAHAGALVGMVNLWNVSPMYSYGYTVPFISLFLLWTRRAELARLRPRPARLLGTGTLMAGLALLTLGRAGGIQVLEQVAFLVSLVAVVLLVLGRAYVRTAWAALAYLLLMIPIWDGLTEPLHAPFQERSAMLGVALLQGVGIPAYREGTLIALPSLSLEVARSCSGVNYLVAVIALGLPLAYLYLPGFWRRALLIVSAMVVAAFSNGLRVALIGILAHFEIGSPLHGPFHVLHGLFVSGAGYAVLFAGLWLLMPARRAVDSPPPVSRAPGPRRLPRREVLAAAAIFAAVGSGLLARQPSPVPLTSELDTLSSSLGAWRSEPWPPGRVIAMWPGADAELHRRYRRSDGAAVDLYVAYYAAQEQGREVASFRTGDLHRRSTTLPVRTSSGDSTDMNLVRDRDGLPEAVFWYEVTGKVEPRAHGAKVRTLWSTLIYGRSQGLAVMLSPVLPATTSVSDLQELGALVHAALEAHLARP